MKPIDRIDTADTSPEARSRRRFLRSCAIGVALATTTRGATKTPSQPEIRPHEVGITTASFQPQFRMTDPAERIELWDLPKIVNGDLGMRIIDINTTILGSHEASHVARFREAAASAGCLITNLKVNVNLPLESEIRAEREHALREYGEWIRAAAALGARWVRPIPHRTKPQREVTLEVYRRLCDMAEARGLKVLVENYRWLESEPSAIPELVQALDGRIAASPDLANWVDQPTRRAGLAAAFPLAVTCDFKVLDLTSSGEHSAFDLKECFALGVKHNFRGPWCIEHVNTKRGALVRELLALKASIDRWARP